ncbi:MAG TPA: hypothetical protein VI299_01000 [Polyangiales bacterium]
MAAFFLGVQRHLGINGFRLAALHMPAPGVYELPSIAAYQASKADWAASLLLSSGCMALLAARALALTGGNTRRWAASIALLVFLVLWSFPNITLPPFQRDELTLISLEERVHVTFALRSYLAAVFATAVLVVTATATMIAELSTKNLDLARLVQLNEEVRRTLALASAWLVFGVVGIALLHAMFESTLPADAAQMLHIYGQASTRFAGAFYTSFLVAVFGPAELAISEATQRATARAAPEKPQEWKSARGLEPSMVGMLGRVMALLAPLLAGPVSTVLQLAK